MRSGVIRMSVRSARRWRTISWPAANGIRWVKPSSATLSPSWISSVTASSSDMSSATALGFLPADRRSPAQREGLQKATEYIKQFVLRKLSEIAGGSHVALRQRRGCGSRGADVGELGALEPRLEAVSVVRHPMEHRRHPIREELGAPDAPQ